MKLSYSTDNSTYTEVSREGPNPSGAVNTSSDKYVQATYALPVAAESDNLYLKFEFYCYNLNKNGEQIGSAYFDEVNLAGILKSVEPTPTPATLAEIITLGEEADGKLYKISDTDGLLGVYKNGTSVWFTDGKQAVDYQNPMEDPNYEYYTVVEKDDQGNVLSSTSEKDFRQYNWIEVVFPSEKDFTNDYVKNLTGTYSCENGNPKLELTVAVDEENDVTEVTSTGLAYEPNPYMAANFVGTQDGTVQGETSSL